VAKPHEHAPWLQVSADRPQSMHAPPSAPHDDATCWSKATHWAPTQHPAHDAGLHEHCPRTHSAPDWHAAFTPHMHTPWMHRSAVRPSQDAPVSQGKGPPSLGSSHSPARHATPSGQVLQAAPPLPHATGCAPDSQRPRRLQQPRQLSGQLGGGGGLEQPLSRHKVATRVTARTPPFYCNSVSTSPVAMRKTTAPGVAHRQRRSASAARWQRESGSSALDFFRTAPAIRVLPAA
jgi:hypothetical protein